MKNSKRALEKASEITEKSGSEAGRTFGAKCIVMYEKSYDSSGDQQERLSVFFVSRDITGGKRSGKSG